MTLPPPATARTLAALLGLVAGVCSASTPQEKRLQDQYAGYRGVDTEYVHAGQVALDKWQDWKFGLRIVEQSVSHIHQTPDELLQTHKDNWLWAYHNLWYQYWNPARFDADEWMSHMQRAGMKYFTVSTKEHDGLCLWPTQSQQRSAIMKDGKWAPFESRYDVTVTPFKKDMIALYVEAARRHGLGIGLYFSHIDWHDYDFRWTWGDDVGIVQRNPYHDPDYNKTTDPESWGLFVQKHRQQIEELLTQYGPIDMLSLDGVLPPDADADAVELAKMIRTLQPHVLIRRRGIGPYGDYSTPETMIPRDEDQLHVFHMPWQTIYNGCNRVSREWLLSTLIEVVAKGGCFQAGFKMNNDGTWPADVIAKTQWIGDWLRVNGEAIYATRPYEPMQWYDLRTERFTWTNLGADDRRTVLQVPTAGTHRLHVWAREDGSLIDSFLLTRDPDYVPLLACEDRDADKSTLVEAEEFDHQTTLHDLQWTIASELPFHSGKGYLQALPDNGLRFDENQLQDSPRLTYSLHFRQPGTYYLWTRQKSPDLNSDSIWFGLDDQVQGLQHLGLYRGGPDTDGFRETAYDYPATGPRTFFTRSKDRQTLYVLCIGWPGRRLVLEHIVPPPDAKVVMLGYLDDAGRPLPLAWTRDRNALTITLPTSLDDPDNRPCSFAWAFRIQPAPGIGETVSR